MGITDCLIDLDRAESAGQSTGQSDFSWDRYQYTLYLYWPPAESNCFYLNSNQSTEEGEKQMDKALQDLKSKITVNNNLTIIVKENIAIYVG